MSKKKLAKLANCISVFLSAKRGNDKEGELVIIDRSYFRIVLCISSYVGQLSIFQHYIRIESDAIENFMLAEGFGDETHIYASRPYEIDGVTIFSSEFVGDHVDLYIYGDPWRRLKNLFRNGRKSYSYHDCARIMSKFIQKDIVALEERLLEYKPEILNKNNHLKFVLLLCLSNIERNNCDNFFYFLSKNNEKYFEICERFKEFYLK